MPELELRCSRCSGAMEPGLMRDHTYGGEIPQEWVRGGPPRRSFLGMAFRVPKTDRLPVMALRCTACGLLELYALDRR